MQWWWCTLVLALLAPQFHFSTSRAAKGSLTAVIKVFIVKASGFNVQYVAESTIDDIKAAHLIVLETSGAQQINAYTDSFDGQSAQFSEDLTELLSGTTYEFSLLLENNVGTVIERGYAKFVFPDLGTLAACESATSFDDNKMLRLTCNKDPGDNFYIDGASVSSISKANEANGAVFYRLFADAMAGTISPRLAAEDAEINAGDISTIDFITDSSVSINAITPLSASVTASEFRYVVDSTPAETTMTLTDTGETATWDELIYWTDLVDMVLCPSIAATDPVTCELSTYTSEARELNILLVGIKEDETPLGYVEHHFTDFDVKKTPLGTSSLEVGWESLDKFSTYQKYELTLTSTATPTRTFDTASVTCSTDSNYCYGYFTSHDDGTYTLTVKPVISEPDLNTNVIDVGAVTFPNPAKFADPAEAQQEADPAEAQHEADVAKLQAAQDAETSALVQESQEVEDAAPGGGAGLGQPVVTWVRVVELQYLGGSGFLICCDDLASVTSAQMTLIHMTSATVTEWNVQATAVEDNCTTFEEDLSALIEEQLVMEVRLYSDEEQTPNSQVKRASVAFRLTDPSSVGRCESASLVADPQLLRLSCSQLGAPLPPNTVYIDDVVVDSTLWQAWQSGAVHYLLFRDPLTHPSTLSLKQILNATAVNEVPDNGSILLSCEDVTIDQSPVQASVVESASLQYAQGTSGATVEVEVSAASAATDTWDVVLYWSDEGVATLSVCAAQSTTQCQLADYVVAERNVSLTLTGYRSAADNRDTIVESGSHLLMDYQVALQQVTGDVVEVRWMGRGLSYTVSLNDGGAFSSVNQSCGGTCKAYFVGLNISAPDRLQRTATVNRADDGPGTSATACTAQLNGSLPDTPREGTVEVGVAGEGSKARVCPSQVPLALVYITTILDLAGRYSEVYDSVSEPFCSSDLDLTQLDTAGPVQVLVHSQPPGTDQDVPFSASLFLLDPSVAERSPRVTQVGSQAVKGEWTNYYTEAVQYTLSLEQLSTTASCEAGQQCVAYLHPDSLTAGASQQASLTEDHRGTVQLVTLDFPVTSIPELELEVPELRWDDRLQVCFLEDELEDAAKYELGLEQDGKYLGTTTDAEVILQPPHHICILSKSPLVLGSYIDLWILVTAYDSGDVIMAAGETNWDSIFLSESRAVYAALNENELLTSWHLLDDINSVDKFVVNLRHKSGSDIDSATTPSNMFSHSFNRPQPGAYTVCVKAHKIAFEDISSEEVCSDIITVSNNQNTEVPEVENVVPLSTAQDTILVTWEAPAASEEVSGYLVSWREVSSGAQHHLLIPPAAMVGLSRGRRNLREVSGDFLLVPGTETSVEVSGLNEGAIYSSCVATIMDNVVSSQDQCTTINLASYEPLSAPLDLVYDEGKLSWEPIGNGEDSESYLVEWRPTKGGHGGQEQVSKTSIILDLGAGTWQAQVRAISSHSSSTPASLVFTVTGVEVSPSQVGTHSLQVSWHQVGDQLNRASLTLYKVTVSSGGQQLDSQIHQCSGDPDKQDCSVVFVDLDVSSTEITVVDITVAPDDLSTPISTTTYTLYPIPQVAGVTQKMRSSSEVEVSWQEVKNAKKYLLNLYSDSQLTYLRFSHVQTLPTRYILTEENMEGNSLRLQGCVDDQHCGDAVIQVVGTTPPPAGGDHGPAILVGMLSGFLVLVGVAFTVVMFIKMKQDKKNKEAARHQQEDQQNYDETTKVHQRTAAPHHYPMTTQVPSGNGPARGVYFSGVRRVPNSPGPVRGVPNNPGAVRDVPNNPGPVRGVPNNPGPMRGGPNPVAPVRRVNSIPAPGVSNNSGAGRNAVRGVNFSHVHGFSSGHVNRHAL